VLTNDLLGTGNVVVYFGIYDLANDRLSHIVSLRQLFLEGARKEVGDADGDDLGSGKLAGRRVPFGLSLLENPKLDPCTPHLRPRNAIELLVGLMHRLCVFQGADLGASPVVPLVDAGLVGAELVENVDMVLDGVSLTVVVKPLNLDVFFPRLLDLLAEVRIESGGTATDRFVDM
jgi:hypothetical protein